MVEQRSAIRPSALQIPGEFFVSRQGETVGPVSADQIAQWVSSGMVDAHVRSGETADWVPLEHSPFAALLTRQPIQPARRPSRATAFAVSCLHFLRWCFAACLAMSLAGGLTTVLCMSAPMSVLDSRDFWIKWATRSPLMASAHQVIDEVFDGAKQGLRKNDQTVAYLGDPAAMAAAFDRARPAVHGAIAGHVIDGVVGFVSGRDDELQLELGLGDLRQRISHEVATAFEAEHCRAGSENAAGCVAGKVALEVGASETVWNTVTTSLGDYNPFSAGFVAKLVPGLNVVRLTFSAVRGFLLVAPLLLFGLGTVLLLSSLRMKTACFMFGWAFALAGAATWLAGWCAHGIAEALGMSPQVWELVAEESGMVHVGMGADLVLLLLAVILFTVRIFGPRWRRAFWQRRLQSSEARVAALAQERLSRSAGLLEPFHVLTAPKP